MSVTAIGTVFMDCKAYVGDNYDPCGRNIGRITINHGGVGRNVAENLGRLGCEVDFLSGVDSSALAQAVLSALLDSGVKTDYVFHGGGMGIWSVISNEKGEQLGSVSQPPNTADVEKYFETIGEELIRKNDLVAIEIDYSAVVFTRAMEIAEEQGKKVYGVIANLDVAKRVPQLLPKLELMVCNDIEAGKLLDITTRGLEAEELIRTLKPAMARLGYKKLLVTAGSRGAVYVDISNGVELIEKAEKVNVIDSVGAGDAFFSGVVAAFDKGCDIRKALRVGTRLAAATIQTECNTCIPPENIFD